MYDCLLNLMSFKTCMLLFFLSNAKEEYFHSLPGLMYHVTNLSVAV